MTYRYHLVKRKVGVKGPLDFTLIVSSSATTKLTTKTDFDDVVTKFHHGHLRRHFVTKFVIVFICRDEVDDEDRK